MINKRALVHAIALFLLPIVVAAFGWSALTAALIVIIMLLWRWAISLSTFVLPDTAPQVVLETIPISHFVEKVRWNMDVAGIEYVELPAGGTLGAFYTGRTVPRLRMKTGAVRSQIGNSAEILRYLWGAYSASNPDTTAHLEPTPERLEFERRLDRFGASLQVWIYYHILDHRALTLHAWGANDPAVPLWQRWSLRVLFPIQVFLIRRSFRISQSSYQRSTERIADLLDGVETQLADGRTSILGGDRNYTDYTFAALCGPWLQPDGYGGGKAESVRLDRERMPAQMRADVERWCEDHPNVVKWIEALYAEER